MRDEWLSEILGYPVYNSTTPPESDERSLTCAKVPVDDVATVHELTGLGFRVVDVNVQLHHGGDEGDMGLIHPAKRSEHKDLLKLAETCFSRSRFHYDPLIKPYANQIKREWLRNCLEGRRGLRVLVAHDLGWPVGFLAEAQDGTARVIDLLGVDREYWGCGIATLLLDAVAYPGRHELIAGTSLSNVGAMRLYEGYGFRMRSASHVLHLHRGVQ